MTQIKKPDAIQMFDMYIDREYFKIHKSFLHSSSTKVRTDRLKDWKELNIVTDELPDKITVNGEEYNLVKVSKS